MLTWQFVWWLMTAADIAQASAQDVLIDRVVVVVDKEVLTATELEIEIRLALALREGAQAAQGPVGPELLATLRDYVINQMLVANQSRKMDVDEISEHDLHMRLAQLKQRFATAQEYQKFLQRFGIHENMVEDIFRRDLRNDRYIAQHLRARALLGSSQEALQQWLQELRQSTEIRLLISTGTLELEDRS